MDCGEGILAVLGPTGTAVSVVDLIVAVPAVRSERVGTEPNRLLC